jgi:predicted cupin superfamily sugar epimerase
MNPEACRIIEQLQLVPLPREGGFFRQTWRDAAGSAIYFLMTPAEFSALHRLPADEVWHFYAGDPVEHVVLDPSSGALRVTRLGADVLSGDVPQLVAPGGCWQGARIAADGARGPSTDLRAGWALLGCTLAPAWDERDFELGERPALLREFPDAGALIRALTR